MAKINITRKEIPTISKDLDLDEAVLRNLKKLQDGYRTTFDGDIQEAQKQALVAYKSKINALNEAKAKLSREYDEEINKYTTLFKELDGQPTKVKVETKGAKKSSK